MKRVSSYIIDNFIVQGFFEKIKDKYELKETIETGKSELVWNCNGRYSLCIQNTDNKPTELLFLKNNKPHHLHKHVDHIILEENENRKWIAHFIEMKTGVEDINKWSEIKGQFRASYLFAKAITAVLDLEIEYNYFYTTYEHASFMNRETNTVPRKNLVGQRAVPPKDEWDGGKFCLRFGEDIFPFKHTPIEMSKNNLDTLIGTFTRN